MGFGPVPENATVGWAAKLACYKFETPEGFRAVHVLVRAHSRRVERGDHHITEEHLADAIKLLLAARQCMPVPNEPAVTAS